MLKLERISKSFGPTAALRDVSLEIAAGESVALLGENGAGKSTLIKIASGLVVPDRGSVEIDGQRVALKSPQDAIGHGIGSVYQELSLVRSLTVEENLMLVDQPVRWHRGVDRRRRRERCRETLERYGLSLRPEARVDRLPLGQQQRLEVIRVIRRDPRILFLDEATSALGENEVAWLAGVVSELRHRGVAVVFISHRWDEVAQFADQVAVLRNGDLVHRSAVGDLDQDEAVRLMSGEDVEAQYGASLSPVEQEVVFAAEDVVADGVLGTTLTIRKGEVLGIGGLVGQGQQDLLRTLFGLNRIRSGSLILGGKRLTALTPRKAIKCGIGYVPQERKTEGLLLDKTVAFNMTLPIVRRLTRRPTGFVRRRSERAVVQKAIGDLRIRSASYGASVSSLSGGNQQKVLLEKWLLPQPTVLLLDDVTRGVDIATKSAIYRLIAQVASDGVAVIMYSTDTLELTHLCHRVLVLREGKVAKELSGRSITMENIVRASVIGGEVGAAA